MQSLMVGGVIGGFAGMLQVIGKGTVQPDTFVPQITFFAWTILILGGAAQVFSPVVGAIIFWFLLTIAEAFAQNAGRNRLATIEHSQLDGYW